MDTKKFSIMINVKGMTYYGTMNIDLFADNNSVFFSGNAIEVETNIPLEDEVRGVLLELPEKAEEL